ISRLRARCGAPAARISAASSGKPKVKCRMSMSSDTTPPAAAATVALAPCSVVTKVITSPCCSTPWTRSASATRLTSSASSPIGQASKAEANHQTNSVQASHAKTRRMNRPNEPDGIESGGDCRQFGFRPRQCAHPEQPDDQHIEHDQRLPDIQMRPFEHVEVPLPEVEQADHPDDVEPLDGDDADGEPGELALPRRRKREDRRHQDDRRLDAVASGLDRDREAVACALQHLAVRQDLGIEQLDDTRADRGQRVRPRHDEPLLRPRRQLQSEQCRLHNKKPEEETYHRLRLYVMVPASRNASSASPAPGPDSVRNSA